MFKNLEETAVSGTSTRMDCATNPAASLVEMFVQLVQARRIARGQCPALRPVFLKAHGVAAGKFVIRKDLAENLRVGVFAGEEYPVWARFSSDTLPTIHDFKTTAGIGIKLFGVHGKKLLGGPDDTTFDLILQNHDVFFVDDAAAMCEFTKAGVVDGDLDAYLKGHPVTDQILKDMEKPVGSLLSTTYWSVLPYAFGAGRHAKYKLEPTLTVAPPSAGPIDPTYLSADLKARLAAGPSAFRFLVQLQSDPAAMPVDRATVRWDEAISVPVHVADIVFDRQDIEARGQAEYGENLAWNTWRVTDEHRPVGSLADARRIVYSMSADQRRNVNGVPAGEPNSPRPLIETGTGADARIVRAAIHPAIGVARVGNSESDFFIGPEVTEPEPRAPGFYRDGTGALKRQGARFRIFGYNAAGQVVRELSSDSAEIRWTVHLANKKAQWYQFVAALDLPEAADLNLPRRNRAVRGTDRANLVIDPGPRSIAGRSLGGAPAHIFDTGKFKGVPVPLGEIRTDEAGRLVVLGGKGKSGSPNNSPLFPPNDPNAFANADDWYDDMSDGPVTAQVSINGDVIPVDEAWVVVAPPNYAPDVIGWRTLHDLLVDVYLKASLLELPRPISFTEHILPYLQRMTQLQWVNKGFAAMFGTGGPCDFDDRVLLGKLAQTPDPTTSADPYRELRQAIFNSFRPLGNTVHEPRTWPWIYGDAYGSFSNVDANDHLAMPPLVDTLMRRWVAGEFVNDFDPAREPPRDINSVPLAGRPAMLDKAALHFCVADAFHPGCEVTWPIRQLTIYSKPFRIRHRGAGERETDFGDTLTASAALRSGGVIDAQGPGDLTRWMAVPWQVDTNGCRNGYERDTGYDPYLPTFWPARVPNEVMTQEQYAQVMDANLPRAARLQAFHRRASWYTPVTNQPDGSSAAFIRLFGAMGVVEPRPGIKDDPDFPEVMYVESVAPPTPAAGLAIARAREIDGSLPISERSDTEDIKELRRLRFRRTGRDAQ